MKQLPQVYLDAVEALRAIVDAITKEKGAPSFVMPPDGVLVPAPLDRIGHALAENDAARAILERAQGRDFTLTMLAVVLEVGRVPVVKMPTIRAFVDHVQARGVGVLGVIAKAQEKLS